MLATRATVRRRNLQRLDDQERTIAELQRTVWRLLANMRLLQEAAGLVPNAKTQRIFLGLEHRMQIVEGQVVEIRGLMSAMEERIECGRGRG